MVAPSVRVLLPSCDDALGSGLDWAWSREALTATPPPEQRMARPPHTHRLRAAHDLRTRTWLRRSWPPLPFECFCHGAMAPLDPAWIGLGARGSWAVSVPSAHGDGGRAGQ